MAKYRVYVYRSETGEKATFDLYSPSDEDAWCLAGNIVYQPEFSVWSNDDEILDVVEIEGEIEIPTSGG